MTDADDGSHDVQFEATSSRLNLFREQRVIELT